MLCTRGTKDGGGRGSYVVQVSGIFLLIIGFLGFPRSPRGNCTLDPESKQNAVFSFESKCRFFQKKILRDSSMFYHVL